MKSEYQSKFDYSIIFNRLYTQVFNQAVEFLGILDNNQ